MNTQSYKVELSSYAPSADVTDVAAILASLKAEDCEVTLTPVAPKGLSADELIMWYEGLTSTDQSKVMSAVSRWVENATVARSISEDPYDVQDELGLEIAGGLLGYGASEDELDEEDPADAAEELGWSKREDGLWYAADAGEGEVGFTLAQLVEQGEIVSGITTQYPLMWSTIWQVKGGNPSYKTAQEIFDFTGMIVMLDEEGRFWYGVDGCGYDFYGDHWLPLAYLYGVLF